MTTSSPPRVLVTRAEEPGGPLSALLRDAGFEPLHAPAVREVPCISRAELHQRLTGMDRAAWFVVTSPRAVRVLEELGVFTDRPPEGLRIAAAGTATASALDARGWAAHRVPVEAGAGPLARSLRDNDPAAPGTVLFPCSARARPELPRALSEAGYAVVEIPVYDMRPAPQDEKWWTRHLAHGPPDALTFTSPSSVQGLAEGLTDAGLEPVLRELRVAPAAVQGPTTAAAVRDAGWKTIEEARPHTFPGLVSAVRTLVEATFDASPAPIHAEVDS